MRLNDNVSTRTTFLILVISVFASVITQAQQRYIPLKEFQGDTVKYMQVNFVKNKNRYIGQKVDSLLKDIEFKITTTFWPNSDPMDNFKIKGISIGYINHIKRRKLAQEKGTFQVLRIYFTPPYTKTRDDWQKIGGVYWKQDYRDFIKDYIIKDIKIYTRDLSR